MANMNIVEIKAFIPAKNYEISQAFYADLGFTQASDTADVAYFYHGNCSFLLQNFYDQTLAENFMMHLLVEDVQSWHQHIIESGIADKYQVEISAVTEQAWGMLDFVLYDPSGVLWRIAQNI